MHIIHTIGHDDIDQMVVGKAAVYHLFFLVFSTSNTPYFSLFSHLIITFSNFIPCYTHTISHLLLSLNTHSLLNIIRRQHIIQQQSKLPREGQNQNGHPRRSRNRSSRLPNPQTQTKQTRACPPARRSRSPRRRNLPTTTRTSLP